MEFSKDFKVVWAHMPLSEDEKSKITLSHQVRPYLLCLEKDDFYYAFPATSKVFTNKTRYQNEKVVLNRVVDDRKSLILLGKVEELPKENICSFEYNIYDYQANEIIKKLNACFEYGNYPEEFKNYIRKMKYNFSLNDLVEVNSNLFVIIGFTINNIILALPVYKYPINNTIAAETDGIIYYVDPKNITCLNEKEINKYCSQLYGFSTSKRIESKEQLEKLTEFYKCREKVKTKKDYSKFKNLLPGMIITYMYNGITYKMIILNNNGSDIEVLSGIDGQLYRDFIPMNLPTNIKFSFEIQGTLNEERLNGLIDKSSEKLYIKK